MKRLLRNKFLFISVLSVRYYFIFFYFSLISQSVLSTTVDSTILSRLSFAPQTESDPTIINLFKSLETAKNAEDSAGIYCRLTWFTSMFEPELIDSYSLKAFSYIHRVNNPRLRSEIYDARAKGYWLVGNLELASEYMVKSLKVGIKYNFIDRMAWCYHNLALIAIDRKESDEAVKYITESIKYFMKMGNYNRVLSDSYGVIIHLIPGNRTELTDLLIKELNTLLDTTKTAEYIIMGHVKKMELYDKIDNKKLAMDNAFKVLALDDFYKSDIGRVTTYLNIGKYFGFQQRNYRVAKEYLDKVLELVVRYNDIEKVAEVLIEKGKIHKLEKNDSLALFNFNTALLISQKMKIKKHIAGSYENIGNIFFDAQLYDKAIIQYQKSLEAGCNLCGGIEFHSVLLNMGKAYMLRDKLDSSIYYFNRSLDLALSVNAPYQTAESYMAIASFYKQKNKLDQTIKVLLQALDKTNECNSISLKKDIYRELAILYRKTGNYKNAFVYYDKSQIYTDSINEINNTEFLAQLETKFEFETNKTNQELKEAKAENEIFKQTQLKRIFIGCFAFMTLLGILLFLGFRRKRNDNQLLIQQKKHIEELTQEMIAANEMKLNFFTNISHEFRTPLTIINGIVDEIKEKKKDAVIDNKKIETLGRNTEKMLLMINQLLDIRKLDKGGMSLNIVNGNISAYVNGIMSSFDDLARQKSIELIYDNLPTNNVSGYFDADLYEKIVTNLISNAIKFTEKGGKIYFTLGFEPDTKDYIHLIFEDTGIGIHEDNISRIFEPLFRVSNYTDGSGIGLSLVKVLIECLHGNISVESKPGEGSKFIVVLPVRKELLENKEYSNLEELIFSESESLNPEDYSIEKDIHPTDSTKDEKIINEKSVLIVEDNSELLNFLSDNLKDEFHIYSASDGKEGFDIAREVIPDLIITDIMMPVSDGIELCRKVKNNEYTNHIPVIMLTAKASDDDKFKGFDVGADDYIIKPFNTKLLKSRIANILKEREKLVKKFSQNFVLGPQQIVIPDRDKVFLEKAIQYIETEISNSELNVENLASSLACSKIQLYRKLKNLTGMPPNQFIRDIRLKRASQLLKGEGNYSISEIMYETGFSNYSYFVNCFRDTFGKTPKEYLQDNTIT